MNKTTLVFGLIGAKGAGKTTVFNAFRNCDILPVEEVTLAAKLKDVCSKVFNIPRLHFDSHSYKEKELESPIFLERRHLFEIFKNYALEADDRFIRPHVGMILTSPRRVAQYIGTEVLRAVDEDIHCKAAVTDLTGSILVVTDMRFPSEFNYFYERYSQFVPLYVKRVAAEINAAVDSHSSEAHLTTLKVKCLYTLDNNYGIKDLEERAIKLFKEVVHV